MSSTDLLSAGTTCSHDACRTIDFLPFKCSHCAQSFCTEHWKPADHDCKQYDAAAEDRILPQCPFCSKPVLVLPKQDPNDAMEAHIDRDCAVFTGKKRRGPVCGNKKCGKALISPIVCQTCKGQFCPSHRFPNAHTCRTTTNAAPSSSKTTTSAPPTPAGLAALKRATVSATSSAAKSVQAAKPAPKASTSTAPSTGNKAGNLIKEIKTDRCEPSVSSAAVSTSPTNNSPPTPKLPTIMRTGGSKPVVDPTKKWTPAPLFGSA
ncbi:SubName: Full=Uncharacterized protein {ECO:0000313/EMBL:CCA73316.1} [Serendipita indica DSM 11827]|uniref:AN1-type domain-containing protein n=1 Tax=Serendipita indica (strain DSM 11827) TaxID=1109443 RepID=G4TPS3_SERID|nr:SubName: Full=Uncharacterized protein {ECO:0000313/EMBL:CCA73316.1} [Serendipita indica DSM 11827]CCA73316.1 hypothetical protein PIIN_07271 [Serendipita indica DSM 11827]